MILARVASVKGKLPISMEAAANGLFLIVGSIPKYLLRVSMWLTCWRMVHLIGSLTLHIK